MFRSKRRDVVFPQWEHARLSAVIANAWGNERFPRPRLPFESFVAGVALHDRGYDVFDTDEIGGHMAEERWLGIQRRGFEPRGEDAVVDLVVALHVHRLAELPEMAAALPGLREAAGVSREDAADADAITDLCDRISFDFCFEHPAEGGVDVRGGRVSYRLDGRGAVTLDPWPLAVPALAGLVHGYAAATYPDGLDPVVVPVSISPSQ